MLIASRQVQIHSLGVSKSAELRWLLVYGRVVEQGALRVHPLSYFFKIFEALALVCFQFSQQKPAWLVFLALYLL